MNQSLEILPAGAGSGKTYRIKNDLADWVERGLVRPERILAVTFTEAAAGELRDRIRFTLMAAGKVEAAMAVERAYVSTIHGLGLRLLGQHAFAAGSSVSPRHLSDPERDVMIRQCIARCRVLDQVRGDLPRFGYRFDFNSKTSAEDAFRARLFGVIDLLRSLGDRGTSPGFADELARATRSLYGKVDRDGAPLGTKLRDAVQAMLRAFPSGCTDLDFNASATKDFARDLRNLRRALNSDALAWDWPLWQQLRGLRQSKRGAATPAGYDSAAQVVMDAAEGLLRHPGPLADICDHASALIRGAQEIMAEFAAAKRAAGVIDFADMIVDAERLLRTRPEVLDAVLAEIDCVIVDEFQDTNPVQFALLWRLAQRAPRVALVGDIKQSIMGFQGADPRLTEALVDQHPDRVEALDRNWRSDPRIMGFVNALGRKAFGPGYTALTPQRSETGQTPAVEVLRLQSGPKARGGKAKPWQHVATHIRDVLAEGAQIVDRHSGQVRAMRPADVAVLCRSHAQAARHATALRQLGVPVRIAEGGWLQSAVVQAALNATCFAFDPGDLHSGLALLTLGPPAQPLEQALRLLLAGELARHPLLAALAALRDLARAAPLDLVIDRVIQTAALRDWAEGQPEPAQSRADLLRLESEVSAFLDAHRDMKVAAGFHGETAPVFRGWLTQESGSRDFDRHPDPGPGAEGVEIVTWHASKGREWNWTIVTGLDGDIRNRPGTMRAAFPDFDDLAEVLTRAGLHLLPETPVPEKQKAMIEADRDSFEKDAHRLIYVATTRARDRLTLAWPEYVFAKLDGSEPPATYAALVQRDAGMAMTATSLTLGDETLPAHVVLCPDTALDGFGAITLGDWPGWWRWGTPAAAPVMTGRAWRQLPSALITAAAPHAPLRHVTGLPRVAVGSGFASAADRGTALHLAMRAALVAPGNQDAVAAATGLTPDEVAAVTAQAEALRDWLHGLGFDRLHTELPLHLRDDAGAGMNGTVDLLAVGPAARMIVDYKSGPAPDPNARFALYWPQLAAYAEASHADQVAILWVETGTITLASAA
ncbi:UvrD-helicase domain-containing protein [Paracoccus lutimaris]|uniref:DNA 3'-5' helicase n=1 Tax=Paracoccus lutimaris TaxID=1490030 RepID=A0A368YN30_9RHOB|nr:UvrD-helicase domain-containing protein [Paracoccus lutimaris]RCW80696.1 ATP-dependent exoDNAse (exonuclease V) beta subunit [Paracoccus lutimaris]